MKIGTIAKKIPLVKQTHRFIRDTLRKHGLLEVYRRGHYYSPLPDRKWVKNNSQSLFRKDVISSPGVDLRTDEQRELIEQLLTTLNSLQIPRSRAADWRYYSDNQYYGRGCGLTLSAMLIHFRPKRIIEVGSGYSSALILDISEKFLNSEPECAFIDPFPERLYSLLGERYTGTYSIREKNVQEIQTSMFEELQSRDFLIIDSSHVVSIGNDVYHIFFEILPRLRPGVIIHFHDIFWPFEYPENWIVDMGRSWNEAYLLRAFLQFNNCFEIVLFPDFLATLSPEIFQRRPEMITPNEARAIWLRKRI